MGCLRMQFMGENVIKNIRTHLPEQRILRLKMRIKRASPDICPVQDLLNGYVIKMLLLQQLVKSLKDSSSCFLLSSIHTLHFPGQIAFIVQ